eukprot:358020-Chlamydomonas_euryale.AAC.1
MHALIARKQPFPGMDEPAYGAYMLACAHAGVCACWRVRMLTCPACDACMYACEPHLPRTLAQRNSRRSHNNLPPKYKSTYKVDGPGGYLKHNARRQR